MPTFVGMTGRHNRRVELNARWYYRRRLTIHSTCPNRNCKATMADLRLVTTAAMMTAQDIGPVVSSPQSAQWRAYSMKPMEIRSATAACPRTDGRR